MDPVFSHSPWGEGVGGAHYSPGGGGENPQRGRDFEAPDLERGIHFRGVF